MTTIPPRFSGVLRIHHIATPEMTLACEKTSDQADRFLLDQLAQAARQKQDAELASVGGLLLPSGKQVKVRRLSDGLEISPVITLDPLLSDGFRAQYILTQSTVSQANHFALYEVRKMLGGRPDYQLTDKSETVTTFMEKLGLDKFILDTEMSDLRPATGDCIEISRAVPGGRKAVYHC